MRNMHKYVWVFVGIFILFVASFPAAFKRVSHSEKFSGFHVKSLTVDGHLESQR